MHLGYNTAVNVFNNMIATSHLIIGGAVGIATGAITQNPVVALFAGIVSHFLCDSLPHWDHPDAPKIGKELVWTKSVWVFAFSDSIIGGIITLALWGAFFDFNLLSTFIWGAAGGYLPDFIDNVPFWKKQVRKIHIFAKIHRFHEWIHENWQDRYPMPKYWVLGSVTQIAIVVPSLFYIISSK
jgi:hypothetical protein